MYQDATCYGGRPWPRPHCARWRLSSPQKRGTGPQFSAHIYCGQTAGCIRIPLGTEVGLILGNIVFDGDPVPHHLKGHSPQFSAHVRCGQTAGVTMMSLGMEVGLGPGDFVLDGDPVPPPPPKKGTARPNFRRMSIVIKRLDGSRCHLVWR